MNILIIGGTGYLGSNIIQSLLHGCHELYCVLRPSSNKSKLLELHQSNKLNFVSNELDEIEFLLEQKHFDWVINTACSYKINDSLYGDLINSNLSFPLQVINIAIKHEVKNYISTGTSLPPKCNDYSFFKSKYDEICEYISIKNHLNFINLCLEMFYGGINETDNIFLNMCFNRLSKGVPLNLTFGLQKRDIVRIEDVVKCISMLVDNNKYYGYKKLPLGSGEQMSIKDIVLLMKNITHSNSDLNFGAIKNRTCEPNTIADISWFQDYNYVPSFKMIDGIIDYCKSKSSIVNRKK